MRFQTRRQYPAFPVILLGVCLGFSVFAADISGDGLFTSGQQYYEAGEYGKARDTFLLAVNNNPDSSRYHHWLGKSYGRLAENAGILEAYALSKKLRLHLERAVELDNRNIPALTDLMEFYRQAPGFLGGGSDKADAVCRRIRELRQSDRTEEKNTPVNAGQDTEDNRNC